MAYVCKQWICVAKLHQKVFRLLYLQITMTTVFLGCIRQNFSRLPWKKKIDQLQILSLIVESVVKYCKRKTTAFREGKFSFMKIMQALTLVSLWWQTTISYETNCSASTILARFSLWRLFFISIYEKMARWKKKLPLMMKLLLKKTPVMKD